MIKIIVCHERDLQPHEMRRAKGNQIYVIIFQTRFVIMRDYEDDERYEKLLSWFSF